MKKKYLLIILLLISFTSIIVILYSNKSWTYFFNPEISAGKKEEIKSCIKGGGIWELLPNSCVDNCDYIRRPIKTIDYNDSEENKKTLTIVPASNKIDYGFYCQQSATLGCNCGSKNCWDKKNKKCEPN